MQREKLSKEILLFILDQLHEAVHVTNKDGIVIYANPAAEKLEYVPLEEMLGCYMTDIYSYSDYDQGNIQPPSLEVLKSGVPRMDEHCEYYSRNGEIVNSIVSNYPYEDRASGLKVVCSVSENINEMKDRLVRLGGVENKRTVRLKNKLMKNGTSFIFDDIIGESPEMKNAIEMAKRFAPKKMPIMIYGETGTGKEMFAQSIHNASPAMHHPFVPINCAAIPETLLESILFGTVKGAFTGAVNKEGLFEKAEKGTIFLDEINSMPLALQAKLLRAIQEKEVQRIGSNETVKINCRILSATNKQPIEAIHAGELREDLFYRLSTGLVFIPPLRERREDIPLLSHYFMEKYCEDLDTQVHLISDELYHLFSQYSWPGNIRELANVIESSVNMTSRDEVVLIKSHLPVYIKNRLQQDISVHSAKEPTKAFKENSTEFPSLKNKNLKESVELFEQYLIVDAMKINKGNIRSSADYLGLTRQGLERKLKKYQMDPKQYRIKKQ